MDHLQNGLCNYPFRRIVIPKRMVCLPILRFNGPRTRHRAHNITSMSTGQAIIRCTSTRRDQNHSLCRSSRGPFVLYIPKNVRIVRSVSRHLYRLFFRILCLFHLPLLQLRRISNPSARRTLCIRSSLFEYHQKRPPHTKVITTNPSIVRVHINGQINDGQAYVIKVQFITMLIKDRTHRTRSILNYLHQASRDLPRQ